jgi:transposase
VADKGYHSNEVVRTLAEMDLRTYIAEPERGERNWNGKAAEKQAIYANRRRVRGARGKRLQSQRGERIERNFAHQFDTGGMDRLYVRGLSNVHKKLLLQAAACNIALLLRSFYGVGKPRAAHDRVFQAISMFLAIMSALQDLSSIRYAVNTSQHGRSRPRCQRNLYGQSPESSGGLDTGC